VSTIFWSSGLLGYPGILGFWDSGIARCSAPSLRRLAIASRFVRSFARHPGTFAFRAIRETLGRLSMYWDVLGRAAVLACHLGRHTGGFWEGLLYWDSSAFPAYLAR